jgi:hypothetical protein
MVIRPDDGSRVLEAMTWSFPRHALSKRTGLPLKPKPVNNARDDKLLSTPATAAQPSGGNAGLQSGR